MQVGDNDFILPAFYAKTRNGNRRNYYFNVIYASVNQHTSKKVKDIFWGCSASRKMHATIHVSYGLYVDIAYPYA